MREGGEVGMIQIDLQMPERCGECPCFHAEYPMHCQLIKPPDKNKRLEAPYGLPRPEWCPLKEKEQEAKISNLMQDVKGIWSFCPKCGYILRSAIYDLMETDKVKSGFHFPNFCANCGQEVKWE